MRLPKIFERGEKKKRFSHPTKWAEVTLKEFIAFDSLENRTEKLPEVLEIFTKIPADDWRMNKTKVLEMTFAMLNFLELEQYPEALHDSENPEQHLPKEVIINDRPVKVPKDVTGIAWAAMEDIKYEMKEENPNYAAVLAAFLLEAYTRQSYDSDAVLKILPDVEQIPAIQAMPILYFFFKSRIENQKNGINALQERINRKK